MAQSDGGSDLAPLARFEARSAGTSPNARKPIGPADIRWADVIFVMERKHLIACKPNTPDYLNTSRSIRWIFQMTIASWIPSWWTFLRTP